jgi:hypothetical protein
MKRALVDDDSPVARVSALSILRRTARIALSGAAAHVGRGCLAA